MKTEVLEEFVLLAKKLNFTETARELYMSQPRLSTHIKALEDELGFKLFARMGNGLLLTPAGFSFLETAQNMLAQLEEGREKALAAGTEDTPLTMFARELEPECYDALMNIRGTHRCVFIDILEGKSPLEALAAGNVDIVNTYKFLDMKSIAQDEVLQNFTYLEISRRCLSIHVHKDHPLASKKALAHDDLRKLKVVIFEGALFDAWRTLLTRKLGADLELEFSLTQLGDPQNLMFVNMGDRAYIGASPVMRKQFQTLDNAVEFDEIDGKQITVSHGFAFNKGNKRALDLLHALQKAIASANAKAQ